MLGLARVMTIAAVNSPAAAKVGLPMKRVAKRNSAAIIAALTTDASAPTNTV
jgi:hypothetical protein